jgi:pimeloyl-ACP methyl ester carboxylesterase
MSEPAQFSYRASGMSFAALAWGPADGPLALCLHGYPDTAWTWRHLGPALGARGWRVVAPFMRGYAPTDLAPDGCYQIGALARDANEAHAALGGDERAVLIGHDWGATAAYTAGALAPSLWRRVVTLAIPPPALLLPPRSPRAIAGRLPIAARQLRFSWYMFYQQLPGISERSLDRLIPRLWADWSPGYDGREDIARVFDSIGEPARRTAAMRYYRALMQPWYRSREYAAEQRRVFSLPSSPVLYMHGIDDGCLQAAYAAGAGVVLAPGSEVELVPHAGHFLALERPEFVNQRIAGFIEQRL